ncbi:uncharacterized protein LOC124702902 isoform X1 [Lolium rigidum]|uniref:uncharacterized protein LOC124702902 isoform X1 n=1 Tax=Lolium rigidum TaxID=89674 RepID=UPI001F5DBD76|nr:uncharacterized protein LOC124702902 isoform X1 [Lolium rigidum]
MAAPKFFNISPYSFHPPALPDPDATTPRPDWVLLDTKAYISDRRNGTTATALASNGVPVEVTFWIADPPVFSHFSVHCKEVSDFAEEPRIICSDKNVAVLCLFWLSTKSARYKVLRDYFVYTARSSKSAAPSLIRLPNPSPRVFNPLEMGLLPTVDGEGFVIAVVRPGEMFPGRYDLHIFSSKNWRWNTKSVLLEHQSVGRANISEHKTDKVIQLMAEGSLGWVDLWRGILLCNVLDGNPNPVLRFIPLPKPLGGNMDIENCPWLYRDVTYINGLIKFVELETWENSMPKNGRMCGLPDHIPDMQFDSDMDNDNMCAMEDNTDNTVSWRAVAWVRKTSQKAWIKDCEAKIHDISINNNTRLSHLLPPLENLMTAAPTLSMCGDDVVVYLMCKMKINDDKAWLIAINMTRKTLEDLALFSAKRIFSFNTTYRPCSFSKHLDMTAGNREAGLQIKEEDDSENTILVDRLDPCITEDQLRCVFTRSGELGHVQMFVHQQCASVKFIHRCSAANAICEFNGFLIGRNHVRVSWKCINPNELQTRDKQSCHQYPQFSGVYGCNPTVEGASLYQNRSRLERHGYHLQQLKLLPLPFRSTNGALQG